MSTKDKELLDEFGLGFEEKAVAVSIPPEDVDIGINVDVGYAQQDLNKLKDALKNTSFKTATPLTPRSPYRDTTQIGIECKGTFTLADWNKANPIITGQTRIFHSFQPEKAMVSERIVAEFDNGIKKEKRAAIVSDAGDLLLTNILAGHYDLFPNKPANGGINGRALSNNSLGGGLSWPSVNAGIDFSVGFQVEKTAMYKIQPPNGFDQDDLKTVEVKATFNLFGPKVK